MVKVGVFGHTGRLGRPLMEILNRHPDIEVAYTYSRREGESGNLDKSEFIFLALPYGESENYLSEIGDKRIIDLSIDHRADNSWVYGLPELNRSEVKNAKYVANPGCYATSIITGLAPIKGCIQNLSIAASSGISGAGEEPKETENTRVYNEGKQHQQIPEIERALGLEGVVFVPEVLESVDRGIVSKMFFEYTGNEDLRELYTEFYKSAPFIRVKEEIETKNVNHTNYCDIKVLQFGKIAIVISAIDNLVKGGSGQAVQNFNVMYGFDETSGLL